MPARSNPSERLLSDQQVADQLGVSATLVRRLRYKRELPTVKIGAVARIPASAVAAYVAAQTTGGEG